MTRLVDMSITRVFVVDARGSSKILGLVFDMRVDTLMLWKEVMMALIQLSLWLGSGLFVMLGFFMEGRDDPTTGFPPSIRSWIACLRAAQLFVLCPGPWWCSLCSSGLYPGLELTVVVWVVGVVTNPPSLAS